MPIKRCVVCGKEFVAKRRNQRLCSDECRRQSERERKREYKRTHREAVKESNRKSNRKRYQKFKEGGRKAPGCQYDGSCFDCPLPDCTAS